MKYATRKTLRAVLAHYRDLADKRIQTIARLSTSLAAEKETTAALAKERDFLAARCRLLTFQRDQLFRALPSAINTPPRQRRNETPEQAAFLEAVDPENERKAR